MSGLTIARDGAEPMSLNRRLAFAAGLTVLVSVAGAARTTTVPEIQAASAETALDSAFVARLRAHLEAATAAEQFSGAVLVARNGRTLFEAGYGLADRERGIPNTPQTKFRAGSMYKMLTAVAALQFVQAGTLRLDAPLGTYLPDYPNDNVKSKVTPHHLLTHTGGTGDIFGSAFMANRLALREVSDYVRLYGTRELQFAPGTQHVYSNYGFILLGALIERLSGKSYHDHIAARVLKPVGMAGTGTSPEDPPVPGLSVGYMRQGGPAGRLVSNAPTLPFRGTSAGGGYSTVGDLARFAVAVRDRRLLDPAHTELLYTGKVQVGSVFKYAYGFIDRVMADRRFVGHGGGAQGMNGELVFEPNGGYVIVVLSNFNPPAAGNVLTYIANNLPSSTPGGKEPAPRIR
jgi:D-alanyl-D-alanine carboxypeptidase